MLMILLSLKLIIPRNSKSMLDVAVRDIHDYCISHGMRLNPKKFKEEWLKTLTNAPPPGTGFLTNSPRHGTDKITNA